MKYITYTNTSLDTPKFVLFENDTNHDMMARTIGARRILGAGFVSIIDGKFYVFGESLSLNVPSRKEDNNILNRSLLS